MSYLSHQLRSTFRSFFVSKGHTSLPSSPLVPSDPSLLFTNAGMVQFKDIFTGKQQASDLRAVTVQKCVRAGGKHNDLENVGRTARHHTFFEMLGNFSFGDYFKEGAIGFAWEFLNKELGLSKERLCFTVFAGQDGIPADDEARLLWKKIAGASDEQIIGLGKKENFWMMGDTGPQGPCSEIHFFQGNDLPCQLEQKTGACLGPACDCDRYLEIWNLVFMQFERKTPQGPLVSLPAPSIDTGAGLERLCSVLQGKRSNYDTDLFVPLLGLVSQASGIKYTHSDIEQDVSMRILADHARATACLIADGVLPSNVGRGYVLRSIMRRAIRHAVKLKLAPSFFSELCTYVTTPTYFAKIYPELVSASSLIAKTVLMEEDGFRSTIERGLRLLESNKDWLDTGSLEKTLPGHVAFTLHDTYGFPLELTQMIGQEQGFLVDLEGFSLQMQEQKNRSKFTGSGDKETGEIYHNVRQLVGPTVFLGYDKEANGCIGTGRVLALLDNQGKMQHTLASGEVGEVILDRTPFYGRSGGQVGDEGKMFGEKSALEIIVEDTWKPLDDLICHRVRVSGTLSVGDTLLCKVDSTRRDKIRKNHSATHLLHSVLRKTLGDHVVQKGSFVGPDKLTFDFTHGAPLDTQTLYAIERTVNEAILNNYEQHMVETDIDEAKKMGALALFGEKYAHKVRVVQLGHSTELCGGTHVQRTGDIGLFKIIGESGIAKGVRRIEALTALAAYEHTYQIEQHMFQVAESLKVSVSAVKEKVHFLLESNKSKDKEISQLKKAALLAGPVDENFLLEGFLGDQKVGVMYVEGLDMQTLRESVLEIMQRHKWQALCLFSQEEQKSHLIVSIDKKMAQEGKLSANMLLTEIAALFGGKGGGKVEMAQASGPRLQNIQQTLRGALDIILKR